MIALIFRTGDVQLCVKLARDIVEIGLGLLE
jgi:hypothetical protein